MLKAESPYTRNILSAVGVLVLIAGCIADFGCVGVTSTPGSAKTATTTTGSIQISPSSASLQVNATQQFTASVNAVTWSATGGSISGTGLYTAPSSPGTYTIQATSTQDATQTASATVTVVTGSAAPKISVTPATLSFGNIAVNSTSSQALKITNVGGGTLAVSGLTLQGDGSFTLTGSTAPLSIAAGQSATVSIVFAPTASGMFNSSLAIANNASSIAPTVAISGTAGTPSTHTVSLNWSPSTSSVVGYFVYRGTTSGGPYTRLISAPEPATLYTDTGVFSGTTYYYVVTAIDGSGVESGYSNQATAAIP